MSPKESLITADSVRRLFSFDVLTGQLIYRTRSGKKKPGDIAGKTTHDRQTGYRCQVVCINYIHYLMHRIVWLHTKGAWPKGCIDHINGDSTDNRIENLREASLSQNQQNKRVSKNNKLGVKGVCATATGNKWRAQIHSLGKQIHLGTFDSLERAKDAYAVAAAKHHQFNPEAKP